MEIDRVGGRLLRRRQDYMRVMVGSGIGDVELSGCTTRKRIRLFVYLYFIIVPTFLKDYEFDEKVLRRITGLRKE